MGGVKLKMKGEKPGGRYYEQRTFFILSFYPFFLPFFLFFFFFFFFFCLLLFETTELCLGCTKMEISTGEKTFHAGKNREV